MANLVILESPYKAPTIKSYLGSNYKVVASVGHVRDLPKSSLGVDIENDFEPKYITIRGKGDLMSKLKKDAKEAKKVYLATELCPLTNLYAHFSTKADLSGIPQFCQEFVLPVVHLQDLCQADADF